MISWALLVLTIQHFFWAGIGIGGMFSFPKISFKIWDLHHVIHKLSIPGVQIHYTDILCKILIRNMDLWGAVSPGAQ